MLHEETYRRKGFRAVRRILAALLCVAVSLMVSARSEGRIDFSSFQQENGGRSLEGLIADAWGCVEREHPDSAVAYYTVAASRYSESLPLRDKKRCAIACVNIGYIWLSSRMNAAEAYPWLMKAQNLARKYGFDDIETSVVSNLGQLYFDYNNMPKAIDHFHDAVQRVMREKGDRYFGRALLDYATAAVYGNDVKTIGEVAERACSYELSPEVSLVAYSGKLADALRHYSLGNHREAAELMEEATGDFDVDTDRKRYLAMHHLVAGRMWRLAGETAKSERHLRRAIDIAAGEGLYNMLEKGYAEMMECSEATGDVGAMRAYQFRSTQIRDSLFNASRFEVVKDLEVAGELNALNERVRAATMEAEIQRTRVVWVTVSVVILLVALVALFIYSRRLKSAYREIFKRNMELAATGIPKKSVEEASGGESKGVREGDEAMLRGVLEKVTAVFESSREIYSPEFTVERLAELCGSREKTVSQAINAIAGKNFNTLIGEYRVREACRILGDVEKMKTMSMEGVAESVGYRSRTYFSRVFKEVTGLTPTQFVKQSRVGF